MIIHQYIILILAWFTYGFIHSFLASSFVKKIVPTPYYRLVYNAIAILLFVVLISFQYQLPKDLLWTSNLFSQTFGIVLVITGIWTLYNAFSSYDLSEFTGFDSFQKGESSSAIFKTSGILQIVRHPIYSSIILVVFGIFVYDALLRSLITACCATLYIRIGIYFEEKKLIITFGENYVRYREQIPMLFPRLNSKLRNL